MLVAFAAQLLTASIVNAAAPAAGTAAGASLTSRGLAEALSATAGDGDSHDGAAAAFSGTVVHRISCGAHQPAVDSKGQVWSQDYGFGNSSTIHRGHGEISGPDLREEADFDLYEKQRWRARCLQVVRVYLCVCVCNVSQCTTSGDYASMVGGVWRCVCVGGGSVNFLHVAFGNPPAHGQRKRRCR